MLSPASQPRMRASILYLGTTFLLATGAVTIADHQIPFRTAPYNPCKCQQSGNNLKACSGQMCTAIVACGSIKCVLGTTNQNFVTCPC